MPRITWTGDASSAEAAAKKLAAAQEAVNKKFSDGAKGAKALEQAAANIIKANEGPQDRYNRKLAEATAAYKAGKISVDDLARATSRYKTELEQAGAQGNRTFGAQALSNVKAIVAGYLSGSQAIRVLMDSLRRAEEQAQAAADRSFRNRRGLGLLSQLAADPDQAKAQKNQERLVAEARSFVERGAVEDENQAGALLFDLVGAGLKKLERAFAAGVQAAGTVQNVGPIAQAYQALIRQLGRGEVGSFQQFLSKTLAAAGPAPGSFEQLPLAVAESGGSAKALGLTDEFLNAAVATVGQARGSISEGGTQVAAFLKQVEKSKLAQRGAFAGKSGIEIVEAIAALPERQQGFGGILGDRAEAIEGYRVLRDNLAEVRKLEAAGVTALNANLAGIAAGLPFTDTEIRSGQFRATSEGRLGRTQQDLESDRENLFQALANEQQKQRTERAGGEGLATFLGATAAYVRDITGTENRALLNELSRPTVSRGLTVEGPNGTVSLLQAIRDHLQEIAKTDVQVAREMEVLNRRNQSKVTTRPE